jgi:hypothetical protein
MRNPASRSLTAILVILPWVSTGVSAAGVLELDEFLGETAGEKIASAIQSLPEDGGVIDCRSLTGQQILDRDVFAGLEARRVTILFGPATFLVSQRQMIKSNVTIRLEGTTFVPAGSVDRIFGAYYANATAATSSGSPTIIVSSEQAVELGDPILVMGQIPRGGRDSTSLTSSVTATDLVLPVASTEGFVASDPADRYLRIEEELIRYDEVTSSSIIVARNGRGCCGTQATGHPTGATVDRAVYEKFYATAIDGQEIQLDRPVAISSNGGLPVIIGSKDVTIEGVGTLKGSGTAEGIHAIAPRNWRIGSGITFRSFSGTAALLFEVASDCRIEATFSDMPGPSSTVAVFFIRNCSGNRIGGSYLGCRRPIVLDDRSTHPRRFDNLSDFNSIRPSCIEQAAYAVTIEGSSDNTVYVPPVRNLTPGNGQASRLVRLISTQWAANPVPSRNVFYLTAVSDPTLKLYVTSMAKRGGNVFYLPTRGRWLGTAGDPEASHSDAVLGNRYEMPPAWKLLEIDAQNQEAEIELFDADAFAVEVLSPVGFTVTTTWYTRKMEGATFALEIRNASGGEIPQIAWSNEFRLAGDFSPPMPGKSKTITFVVGRFDEESREARVVELARTQEEI